MKLDLEVVSIRVSRLGCIVGMLGSSIVSCFVFRVVATVLPSLFLRLMVIVLLPRMIVCRLGLGAIISILLRLAVRVVVM